MEEISKLSPNSAMVAHSILTMTIPHTMAIAADREDEIARWVTATKFGPGLITPATQTMAADRTTLLSSIGTSKTS